MNYDVSKCNAVKKRKYERQAMNASWRETARLAQLAHPPVSPKSGEWCAPRATTWCAEPVSGILADGGPSAHCCRWSAVISKNEFFMGFSDRSISAFKSCMRKAEHCRSWRFGGDRNDKSVLTDLYLLDADETLVDRGHVNRDI